MSGINAAFSKFATLVAEIIGKPATFVAALALVAIWAISGPFFDFSEVWQLIINTSTTIITFLMIFVLQNTQNRDGEALQTKLDELILTSKQAQNNFVGIEKLDEKQLNDLRELLDRRAKGDEVHEYDVPGHLKGVRARTKADTGAKAEA